jgi:serine kinase of HPr protein (carbohydrate metabolism regulator)
MAEISSETLHASCVAIGEFAVLIEGLSGSGKSDLALRLIDRGAVLVSDDYSCVRRENGQAIAAPAANIAGLLEVRGVGLIAFPNTSDVPIALIVNLNGNIERFPDQLPTRTVVGVPVPVLPLSPFEASAPLKVELALQTLSQP